MPLRRFVTIPLLVSLTAAPGSDGLLYSRGLARQEANDPCASALAQADRNGPARSTVARPSGKDSAFGIDTRHVTDLIVPSQLAARTRPLAALPSASASRDIDDIAIIEDDGTLILSPNPFDLGGTGVRFEPTTAGYDATAGDAAFRSVTGRALALGDDDAMVETLAFQFPYHGRRYSEVFVNSDGNLTFEAADVESSERGFARLLGGPPRVAPYFADLDPSAGGRVFVESTGDVFAVTWCRVPGFDSAETMTMQVVLGRQGTVDLRYGSDSTLQEGIAALSPGRGAAFTPIDLTVSQRRTGGPDAIGERFSEEPALDLAQTARRFYLTHPDAFDQLVFWTDTRVVSDAFAFESTVKNTIQGIGVEQFDSAPLFGSAGTLASVVNMDRVSKYGDDPSARILGESSTLAVLAHETGHRWLARIVFSDRRGGASDLLLGRQRAHWSFFMDSDASVMEGNDISVTRGSSFRTVAAAERYGRLDLYAMGLVGASEVPPFFYVESPVNVVPSSGRESAPRTGTTFSGTRREVRIQDVIDALGPRVPSTIDAARVHRQAFIYVIRRGTMPGAADLSKLGRIRRQWEPYFLRATEQRMSVRTTLTP